MKKAIGMVSFGTTYKEAELSCICPIERAIAKAFPDWDCRRAFTSRIIARRLKQRGEAVDSETELIERLRAEGYEKIVLATTHVIPGFEYDKLRSAAGDVRVSEPLISGEEDELWMAAILERIAKEEGRLLLVMGHGTDHAADETYARLQKRLSGSVLIGCAEGERTLEAILPELEATGQKKVVLAPMMIVAGDHARNDLAGDGEESWKSILTEQGYDVCVRMQGLGAIEDVQQRFVEKTRRVTE